MTANCSPYLPPLITSSGEISDAEYLSVEPDGPLSRLVGAGAGEEGVFFAEIGRAHRTETRRPDVAAGGRNQAQIANSQLMGQVQLVRQRVVVRQRKARAADDTDLVLRLVVSVLNAVRNCQPGIGPERQGEEGDRQQAKGDPQAEDE